MGAVVLTVSLNRFYHSHNLIIFLIAMLLGSVMGHAPSLFMAPNIAVTLLAVEREGQRAAGVPATTWEQRLFDEQFPDSYLQSRTQNMSMCGKG